MSCSKDGTAKMWNCGSAECLRTWHPEAGHVNALAISPSSSSSGTNIFGVACESGKANVYDLRSNDSGILVVVPGENCTAITFCGIASTDSASEDANLYIGTEEGSIIGYSMKAG
ncbi:unnamed protein product [Anisakis simplex]|uniref:Uncharacterized protein n=1 Tax=Anisakis simplex TaxID=6269 RepID=A0A3P6NMY5_ANISI|nr:unnamed protein product [Anisakis simplex]